MATIDEIRKANIDKVNNIMNRFESPKKDSTLEMSEEQLSKAVESGEISQVYDDTGLNKFGSEIRRRYAAGKLSNDDLEKAKKDLSKLVKVKVVDSRGHSVSRWVKRGEEPKKETKNLQEVYEDDVRERFSKKSLNEVKSYLDLAERALKKETDDAEKRDIQSDIKVFKQLITEKESDDKSKEQSGVKSEGESKKEDKEKIETTITLKKPKVSKTYIDGDIKSLEVVLEDGTKITPHTKIDSPEMRGLTPEQHKKVAHKLQYGLEKIMPTHLASRVRGMSDKFLKEIMEDKRKEKSEMQNIEERIAYHVEQSKKKENTDFKVGDVLFPNMKKWENHGFGLSEKQLELVEKNPKLYEKLRNRIKEGKMDFEVTKITPNYVHVNVGKNVGNIYKQLFGKEYKTALPREYFLKNK